MVAAIPWNAEIALGLFAALAMTVGARRPSWQRLLVLAGLAMAAVLAPTAQRSTVLLSLVALAAVRGTQGRVAPAMALATLGLMRLPRATTLDGLLIALVLAGTGLTLVRRLAGHEDRGLAPLGFALAACGGALWCGLGGDLDLHAAREGLAARATLPVVAVFLPLPLFLGGMLLTLLAPVRRALPATAAWLIAVPLLGIVEATVRVVLPLPPVPTLHVVPPVLLVLGAVLALGSLLAALVRADLSERLLVSAPALVGLAWVGLSCTTDPALPAVVTAGTRLLVPALLAGVLLLHGGGPRRLQALGLTAVAATLSGLPPAPAWQPRRDLLERLLAGEAWAGVSLVALGTLLGLLVYLPPVVDHWRAERAVAAAAPTIDPLGRALAWLLVAGVLVPTVVGW